MLYKYMKLNKITSMIAAVAIIFGLGSNAKAAVVVTTMPGGNIQYGYVTSSVFVPFASQYNGQTADSVDLTVDVPNNQTVIGAFFTVENTTVNTFAGSYIGAGEVYTFDRIVGTNTFASLNLPAGAAFTAASNNKQVPWLIQNVPNGADVTFAGVITTVPEPSAAALGALGALALLRRRRI